MENKEVNIDAIRKITEDTEFWRVDLFRTREIRKDVQSRLEKSNDPLLFLSTEHVEHREARISFERNEFLKILDDHEAHVIKLLEAQGNKLTDVTNVDDEELDEDKELDFDDLMELEERRKNGR